MGQMKVFRNNFEPISYELYDASGEKKIITQKTRMTSEISDKIEELAYKNKDLTTSQRIIQQLMLIFEEPEDFWKSFDIGFLGDILVSFSEDCRKKK